MTALLDNLDRIQAIFRRPDTVSSCRGASAGSASAAGGAAGGLLLGWSILSFDILPLSGFSEVATESALRDSIAANSSLSERR